MNSRGHSLAEVMVSLFLLGFVIAAIINLWPVSLLGVERAEARLQGQSIARSSLEVASRIPWFDLGDLVGTDTLEQGGRSFNRTVTVGSGGPGLYKVTVRVEWNDRGLVHVAEDSMLVSELHH